MDEHKFSKNEVTILYQRLIKLENDLAALQRNCQSQNGFLLQEINRLETTINALQNKPKEINKISELPNLLARIEALEKWRASAFNFINWIFKKK